MAQSLSNLLHTAEPGKNDSLKTERILLEYVSANPTGPLHIGHGRWAALGDSIVRVLRHCGAFVTPEFYINDAGVQMVKMGFSILNRCREMLVEDGRLPRKALDYEIELAYPGEYINDITRKFFSTQPQEDIDKLIFFFTREGPVAEDPNSHFWTVPIGVVGNLLTPFARNLMLSEQRALLNIMHVHFENWISEEEHLYNKRDENKKNPVQQAFQKLKDRGYVYPEADAWWFKSTEFGDEKDRVLKKSDHQYTYLMPDIAYHDDKFNRPEKYNRIMNIWGADHHGYIPRMRGAIQALGHDPEQFEVLLGQLVNLIVDGAKTRMGKRRKMLTLEDVIRDIGGMDDAERLDDTNPAVQAKVQKGVDATRFWMVSKSADSALDFDVDLAASASSENPVFYVQYAHARCCSILRNAVEAAPDIDAKEMKAPYVQETELLDFESKLDAKALAPLFDSLTEAREQNALKTLVLHLDAFEDIVKDAARMRAPHFITQYMMDLAANFHSFYNVCRILTPDPNLTKPRLMLIRTIRKTLAQGLNLLGVSAPEKM